MPSSESNAAGLTKIPTDNNGVTQSGQIQSNPSAVQSDRTTTINSLDNATSTSTPTVDIDELLDSDDDHDDDDDVMLSGATQ